MGLKESQKGNQLLRIPGYRDSQFSKDVELGNVKEGSGSMAVSLLCFSIPLSSVRP